jgi:RNA polymerase sigma-70 factor (ECF subfamily)
MIRICPIKRNANPFNRMKTVMTHSEASDAELLRAFSCGDAKSLDVLVERYRPALFSWFVGMTANRADAEDLFQDLWIRVMRHAGRFNDVSFKAWIWRIARNLLIDFRRKKKPDISLDAVESEDDQPLLDQLVSAEAGPAERSERSDLTRRVMRVVGTLPAVQREVLLLRVQADMPFSEIAELLGIPLNTALGRMHDATTKLKKALAEEKPL